MRALRPLTFLLLVACQDYTFKKHGDIDPVEDEPAAGHDDADLGDPPDETEEPEDTAPPEDTGEEEEPEEVEEEDPVEPEPEAGCADGQREGFLDWDVYPDIAACSGAWSEPGITGFGAATTCGHGAGDDSGNTEGSGCSAADLCQTGWHVCDGAAEVADLAGSCDDAVPPGTPDKALFFAVSQTSDDNTVCDDGTSAANDVFGCGNLGHTLDSSKGCGPLDRALASMSPDSCGYNEAEPGHGPWECNGGSGSHLAEGALVTKAGCPGGSCSYDGASVGNSDKGGVLCCRD